MPGGDAEPEGVAAVVVEVTGEQEARRGHALIFRSARAGVCPRAAAAGIPVSGEGHAART